jgi:hypothetical protein
VSGWAAAMSAELGAGTISRLAALEAASRGLRAPRELARIRADLLAVIGMWRGLLAVHAPVGERGRCQRCRGWWGRRGPCRVWTAAHTVLVALEYPAQAAGPPLSGARRFGLITLRTGAEATALAGLTIRPRSGADRAKAVDQQRAQGGNQSPPGRARPGHHRGDRSDSGTDQRSVQRLGGSLAGSERYGPDT